MAYGYNGKILRADLTRGSTSVEEPGEDFFRRYLGGTALISYFLLKEQAPKVDPFSPENRIIFATGVATGAPIGGSGRNAIGTKSPLGNAFSSAEVGGYWGAELKRAGYDAVIIEGKAEKPVYLWIQDGKVEIKDANHLWGKSVGETQETMRQELGDLGVRTALIGPGGERLVRFACVVNDLGHFAGRGGAGAVLGAKNLKGIAVRGHNPPPMADPKAIGHISKWFRDQVKTDPFLVGMHAVGTITGPQAYSKAGGYCVRNFQEGVFPEAEKLSPGAYMSTQGLGPEMDTCYACPVRCKHKVTIKDTYNLTFEHYHGHGPEYEVMTSFGPFCGVGDLQAIACANELSTAYGVDGISCGSTIACAMECFEKGLITEKDTGGLKLEFGNAEAMLKAVEMICKREGFGDVLAEGSLRFTQKIGKGAEQYAMQSRGVELPLQNPYFKPILGLGYAVCPTGGDHVRNLTFVHVIDADKAGMGTHSEARDQLLSQYRSLGLLAPVYRREFSDSTIIRELIYVSTYQTLLDSLGFCWFASLGIPYHQMAAIVNKITGWDTTVFEMMKVGERAMNMMRAFNIREGQTREDDRLPERFHQPLASGPLKGVKFDKEEFEKAKDIYYGMMGWDQQGNPTRGKLLELDIEWAADELQKALS
jgi:aldehyde:ferredoxin oxidoreductase